MATVPRQFRIVSSSTVPHYMGKHNPTINGGIVAFGDLREVELLVEGFYTSPS